MLGEGRDKCCTSQCPRLCHGAVPKCYAGYGRARPNHGCGMEMRVPVGAIGTLRISAGAMGQGAAKGTAVPREPVLLHRDLRPPTGDT